MPTDSQLVLRLAPHTALFRGLAISAQHYPSFAEPCSAVKHAALRSRRLSVLFTQRRRSYAFAVSSLTLVRRFSLLRDECVRFNLETGTLSVGTS